METRLCSSVFKIHLKDLTQSFLLFETDLSNSHNKVCGYINLEERRVYVNEQDPEPRRRFTAAHELGHFMLHRARLEENPSMSVLSRSPISEETDPIEIEANKFAAALLMPEKILSKFRALPTRVLENLFCVDEETVKFRLAAFGRSD